MNEGQTPLLGSQNRFSMNRDQLKKIIKHDYDDKRARDDYISSKNSSFDFQFDDFKVLQSYHDGDQIDSENLSHQLYSRFEKNLQNLSVKRQSEFVSQQPSISSPLADQSMSHTKYLMQNYLSPKNLQDNIVEKKIQQLSRKINMNDKRVLTRQNLQRRKLQGKLKPIFFEKDLQSHNEVYQYGLEVSLESSRISTQQQSRSVYQQLQHSSEIRINNKLGKQKIGKLRQKLNQSVNISHQMERQSIKTYDKPALERLNTKLIQSRFEDDLQRNTTATNEIYSQNRNTDPDVDAVANQLDIDLNRLVTDKSKFKLEYQLPASQQRKCFSPVFTPFKLQSDLDFGTATDNQSTNRYGQKVAGTGFDRYSNEVRKSLQLNLPKQTQLIPNSALKRNSPIFNCDHMVNRSIQPKDLNNSPRVWEQQLDQYS